jgi:hypothetical protein
MKVLPSGPKAELPQRSVREIHPINMNEILWLRALGYAIYLR